MVVGQEFRTIRLPIAFRIFPLGTGSVALHAKLLVCGIARQKVDPRSMVRVASANPFLYMCQFGESLRRRLVPMLIDIKRRMVLHAVNALSQCRCLCRIVKIDLEPNGLGVEHVDCAHPVLGGIVQLFGRSRPHCVEAAILQLLKPAVIQLLLVRPIARPTPLSRNWLSRLPRRNGDHRPKACGRRHETIPHRRTLSPTPTESEPPCHAARDSQQT